MRRTDLDVIERPYDGCGKCLLGVRRLSRMKLPTSSPERQREDVLTAAASVGAHIIGWADDWESSWPPEKPEPATLSICHTARGSTAAGASGWRCAPTVVTSRRSASSGGTAEPAPRHTPTPPTGSSASCSPRPGCPPGFGAGHPRLLGHALPVHRRLTCLPGRGRPAQDLDRPPHCCEVAWRSGTPRASNNSLVLSGSFQALRRCVAGPGPVRRSRKPCGAQR